MSEYAETDVAIVGAGPYGLSLAAHLRQDGIEHRIFGSPMETWVAHMPRGMCLKSDGFASNLYDRDGDLTLGRFCAEGSIKYADIGLPVALETFNTYGLAFAKRMVPQLEEQWVSSVGRSGKRYVVELANGESFIARRVVLAVGITHFAYVPPILAHLPANVLSHSFQNHDLQSFKGRRVVVLGAGASAIDLAGLLHEEDVDVTLVARRRALNFHSMPLSKRRSAWQRLRHPDSGLGPSLRTWLYSNAPGLVHHLPGRLRRRIVRTTLGPSGGWFVKQKVIGRVPLMMGCSVLEARLAGNSVQMRLRAQDGAVREITADHVIAATGYKVDVDRLKFLSPPIRSRIRIYGGSPALSSQFESSVPGLYFVGLAAANSFGPVMRFAFGAGFAAQTLSRTLKVSRSTSAIPSFAHGAEEAGRNPVVEGVTPNAASSPYDQREVCKEP